MSREITMGLAGFAMTSRWGIDMGDISGSQNLGSWGPWGAGGGFRSGSRGGKRKRDGGGTFPELCLVSFLAVLA